MGGNSLRLMLPDTITTLEERTTSQNTSTTTSTFLTSSINIEENDIVKKSSDTNRISCTSSDACSIDTNDAFFDVFGIDPEKQQLDFGEEDCDENSILAEDNSVYSNQSKPVFSLTNIKWYPLNDLPRKCSRFLHAPSKCFAMVLDHVFDTRQCTSLINLAKSSRCKSGFQYIKEAIHTSPDGSRFVVQIHKPNQHKLAILDTDHNPNFVSQNSQDESVASQLLNELYRYLHETLIHHESIRSFFQKFLKRTSTDENAMMGLNPRMRILKYDSRDKDLFEAHFDATTKVQNMETCGKKKKSLITVLLYLNDDFDGGETVFLDYKEENLRQKVNDGTVPNAPVVKVKPKTGRVVLFEHDLFHSGAPLLKGSKYIMRTDLLFEDIEDGEGGKTQNFKSAHAENKTETPKVNKTLLISDLCKQKLVNISPEDEEILESMELLYITCESFLSPGLSLLRAMLIDGGVCTVVVNDLVTAVLAVVRA